ncbi:hypothetical protein H4R33_004129 [Dimargaris cristalligena]|nr:hypothetical protein H4R33_004129 [Dimargaris cristalligena]
MPYYAVRNGRRPGVYPDWPSCQQQVTGFAGATYKKFGTLAEAERFSQTTKFYESASPPSTHVSAGSSRYSEPSQPRLGPSITAPASTRPTSAKRSLPSSFDPSDTTVSGPSSIRPIKQLKMSQPVPNRVEVVPSFALRHLVPRLTERQRVYTDGAASKNGRQGARAGVGVYYGPNDPRNVSEPLLHANQTNQCAELTAIKRALETSDPSIPLEICTDSQYSIDCITKWCKAWDKNGWKTSTGAKVVNADVIQGIRQNIQARGGSVSFTKVRGHSGDPGNDMADRLAVEGARKGRI